MRLRQVTLHQLRMPLKSPFTTSFGTIRERECTLLEVLDDDGIIGWGECVAFSTPWYTEETTRTTTHILKDFLLPALTGIAMTHPVDLVPIFQPIRRNHMAKAALEGALWDLYAKRIGQPLAIALGGTRRTIEVGVALGIMPLDELLRQIAQYVDEGYRRIKIKIKPGLDVQVVAAVRRAFPQIALMVDANSAYSLADASTLRELDAFDLQMIEQPLGVDDLEDHAVLQTMLNTPICLDESIHRIEDARLAIRLGSCRVVNIKVGRVGGLSEAMRIHDLCKVAGVDVWCGGMLDTGVARAHNIAIASLPQFTLPGDISASSRYWQQDIIKPEVTVSNGLIELPLAAGIGYEVDRGALSRVTVHRETIRYA